MTEPLWDDIRGAMVTNQLVQRGIHDNAVVQAMLKVPREKFVPEHLRENAYDDCPLPIAQGQTISQPYTVAFMVQELTLEANDVVLDVGTGSGYAAAVLSKIVRKVYSIERFPELANKAQEVLQSIGCTNVEVIVGDGAKGYLEHAPYDAIIVAAAAEQLPTAYKSQLRDGGRIIIPIGDKWRQRLMRFTLIDGQLAEQDLGAFAFVPLVGQ